MRLAQIARKVKVTPNEIKQFLEKEFELSIGKDPNYKLEPDHIEAVIKEFPVEIITEPSKTTKVQKQDQVVAENSEETIQENESEVNEQSEVNQQPEEEATPEEPIIETIVEEHEQTNKIAAIEDEEPATTVIIAETETAAPVTSAETNEEIDFTEVPVDPDAELIKAPTVKLNGLKILGKIELPEKAEVVQEKTTEELEAEEQAQIAALDAAMHSSSQDIKTKSSKTEDSKVKTEEEEHSEYKDKRGNYHFSSAQRQNRIKSLEKKKVIKKEVNLKEKKKKHYEDLMRDRPQKTSVKEIKVKAKKTEATKKKKEQKSKPAPKGLWARFVHWLND